MENQFSDLTGLPNLRIPTIEPLSTGKIALHDADYIKYLVTSRVFKNCKDGYYPPPDQYIKDILEALFTRIHDPIIFCFSSLSSKTFRYHLASEMEYKGSRKFREDTQYYDRKSEDAYYVVEYIKKSFIVLMFGDLEADDIVSALQDDNTYIMSKDKDLKQVPGWHYSFTENSLFHISQEQGLLFLANQLIKGDGGDDICGIKGFGEKASEKILKGVQPNRLIQTVLHEYHKKYGLVMGTDMFSEMWQLLKTKINRGDYFKEKYALMFTTKNIILNDIKSKETEI